MVRLWLICMVRPGGRGHFLFFFQAEDGIREPLVTGVQTCALPISGPSDSGTAIGAPPVSKRVGSHHPPARPDGEARPTAPRSPYPLGARRALAWLTGWAAETILGRALVRPPLAGVARGNPVRIRSCPAAVSGNDSRQHSTGPETVLGSGDQ